MTPCFRFTPGLFKLLAMALVLAGFTGHAIGQAPALGLTITIDTGASVGDGTRLIRKLDTGEIISASQVGTGAAAAIRIIRHNPGTGVAVWSTDYSPGDSGDDPVDMVVDPATGDAYISANATVTGQSLNWLIFKVSGVDGTVQWHTFFNGVGTGGAGNSNDSPRSICKTTDGNLVVCGQTLLTTGANGSRVAKYNGSTGAQMWAYEPTAEWQDYMQVVADSSGNAIACGYVNGLTLTGENGRATKFKSDGTILWDVSIDGVNHDFDAASTLTVDAAGNSYVGLESRVSSSDDNILVVKLNASGTEQWRTTMPTTLTGVDAPGYIALDPSGDVYVVGSAWETGTGSDAYIGKLNGSTGAFLWKNSKAGSDSAGSETMRAVAFNGSEVYAVGNMFNIVSATSQADFFIGRYDPTTGAEIWGITYNSSGTKADNPSARKSGAIVVTGTDKLFVCGTSQNPTAGPTDGVILRYGAAVVSGSAPTVSTDNQASVTYNSATLGGNVTADGGVSVTDRGIVWGTATGPTTADNKVANGSGLGTFSATVSGLASSATIYVRAYATNGVGTSYGNEISFATPAPPAPATAVSGNGNNVAYQANAAAASPTNGTDFGTVPVAGLTQENTFTITNSGTAALTLTGGPNYVSVSPAGAFTVTAQPSGTVSSGGGTTTFKISFDPSVAGAANATVSFGSNDSAKSPFTFAIVGNGSGPQTFDLAGNAISNTPYDGGESYIYSAAPPPPTVVFTSGVDTPPGAPGTSFDSVRSGSVIASSGAIAFRGFLALQGGPPLVDANNYMGIWKTPDGTTANTTLVTRSDNTAPDSSSALFDILPVNPVINNAGQTSFLANLRTSTGSPTVTTSTDTGVWSELGGVGLHLILREGDSVAGGTAGAVAPSTTVATGDGHTAFTIKLTPTGSALIRAGVVGSTVTLATIAKQGDPAPAVGGGTSGTMGILSGNSSDPRLDAAGDLAFLGSVTGGSRIFYQSIGGSLAALTAAGQTWPGLPDAFVQFERPTLGNSTTIAFRGITVTLQAILKGSPTGTITAITKTGDTTVPGTPAGSQLWSLWSPFSNSVGHIAFRGSLLDSASVETRCILTDTSGTLSIIAKVGDTAPGTGGDTFDNFDHPVIGDGDQAAFTASTAGGVVGLWRQSTGGGALNLLMKVGDTFTVGAGTETVAQISVPGASSADRTYETKCMDAAGHMVVFVTYVSGKTGYVLTSP